MNFLVMGPWRHSEVNYDGTSLGPLQWNGDTALQFRRDVLKPFFDQYLKDGAPKADTPPVFIYNTGENHWDRFKSWPLAASRDAPSRTIEAALPRLPENPAAVSHVGFERFTAPRNACQLSRCLRRVCLRSRQAGALSAASGRLRRLGRMEGAGS